MLLFFNIGGSEMIIILLVIVMFFGSKKIPELARALGKAGGSQDAVRSTATSLLTLPNPSALDKIPMSTHDVINTNSNIGLLSHLLGGIGYDCSAESEGRK